MSEKKEYIRIRGAREHNLKNIDVNIPRNEFVVLTGLSGSGKSSLAFDTIYAEGQRRYMESLSSYARQFLGQMEKPDVDDIQGLSPAISIDQKSTNRNPRSTVGTVTEIYDYLRLLYARVGIPHCPKCGKVIEKQTVDQIVDTLMGLPERTKIQLLAPIVRGRKGEHVKILDNARRSGYVRVRIDGKWYGAVGNAGIKPTVTDEQRRLLEVFVYGYEGDAYGKEITAQFCDFERPETKFGSVEELKDNVMRDMRYGERYFASASAAFAPHKK